jgi:hypothetical protein
MLGQERLDTALKGMWRQVRQGFAQVLAQMAVDWMKAQATRLAIAVTTEQGILAARVATALASAAIAVWEGIKWVAVHAYKAAAAAYAAIAEIPVVGPFLAPAVAAGVLAAVLAMGAKVASARGGYDVPSGINPLVQTHAEEMVLPQDLSNGIREMVGSGRRGRGGDTYITAMDAVGVYGALRRADHGVQKYERDRRRDRRV